MSENQVGKSPIEKETPGTPAAEAKANPEQPISILPSQLEKMMQEMMQKQFGTQLGSIMSAQGEVKAPNLYDPEDVLDEPAVFFSHNVGRMYMDDTKDGKEFKNPLGRTVHFTLWMTDKGGTLDNPTVVHLSRYITKSKKEAAWLKSHSDYGIGFWDYTPDLKSVDMADEMIRDEAGNRIKRMSDETIVQLTKQNASKYGLKVLPSYADMRKALIPVIKDMVNIELNMKSRRILEKTQESNSRLGITQ